MIVRERLRPLSPTCVLSVVIPANDEEQRIGSAIEALVRQRGPGDEPLDPHTYEIVVFAHNCTDDTARIARASARAYGPSVHVVEARTVAGDAHVGAARKAALDLVLARHRDAHRPRGILASTDADSTVDARWVATTIREMRAVDAVAGAVSIDVAERARMLAPTRLLYDRELTYRRLLGEIEDLEDPQAHDPGPRHDEFVGASFAVTAHAYEAAGGLPALPALEDRGFALRLARIDAKIRHSYDVRVSTSGRTDGRAAGGFGAFVADLEMRGSERTTFFVRAAASSIAEARGRAALRRLRGGTATNGDLTTACVAFALDARTIRASLDGSATLGETMDAVRAYGALTRHGDETVEDAIAAFREHLRTRRPVAAAVDEIA